MACVKDEPIVFVLACMNRRGSAFSLWPIISWAQTLPGNLLLVGVAIATGSSSTLRHHRVALVELVVYQLFSFP